MIVSRHLIFLVALLFSVWVEAIGIRAVLSAEVLKKGGYTLNEKRCGVATVSFPHLPIGMKDGYCAGLVASKDDGLRFPRSIVQIPDHSQFVISDMGEWNTASGRLLLLNPSAPETYRVKEILTGLDYPFGLAIGPDKKVYASTAEMIFRFDPLASNPKSSVEIIIKDLPGRRVTLSNGVKIQESSHPFKQFVFDKNGRLFVNVGSHSDDCRSNPPIRRPCPDGEGSSPLASIWMFTPPAGGIFPALKSSDPNPRREIYAQGLRNSMALAVHPNFPEAGFAFLQAENGQDLPDIFKPNEEINSIEKDKHYGWPYCYDISTPSPTFRDFLQLPGKYKNFCNNDSLYKSPLSLLPPHGAPLGMFYYYGERFPELKGRLIVGLHGYRPTGSRLLIYEVDQKGFPILSPPPVHYNVSCDPQSKRSFRTETSEVSAAAYAELISHWYRVNGVRPQGAPVGMTVASDGAIWLVEDKNQTVIRIDRATDAPSVPLPCNQRTSAQIDELTKFVEGNAVNKRRLTAVRTGIVEKHCIGCHSDFGLFPKQSDQQKDRAVLQFLLSQDGWIYPGDPDAGKLRARLRGTGAGNIMPPGGEALASNDKNYRQLLNIADYLVGKMVPGTRMRVRPGRVQRSFFSESGKECGSIPTEKVVVVTERQARKKTGYSRFYRPADLYLNGECTDGEGYYIESRNLIPL